MTSRNEQDLIFRAKFEDDASEDMKDLGGEVEELDKGMGGLQLSFIGAGLAMFGMAVGVQKVAGTVNETVHRTGALKGAISLLPEGTQQALDEMAPLFIGIGKDFAATELEVKEVAGEIARAAGGMVVPSVKDIELAFAVAKTFGIGTAEAARLVGLELQGNAEGLEKVLDSSDRSFIGAQEAQEKLIPIAKESVTWLDKVLASLRHQQETLSNWDAFQAYWLDLSPPESLQNAWDNLLSTITETLALGGDNSIGIEEGETIEDALERSKNDNDILNALGLSDEQIGNLTPVTPLSGFNGSGASGFGDIDIHGDVDTAARAQEMARQIDAAIRNLSRGGVLGR